MSDQDETNTEPLQTSTESTIGNDGLETKSTIAEQTIEPTNCTKENSTSYDNNEHVSEATAEINPNASELDRSEIISRRKQKKLLKLAKWEEVKRQKRLKERQKFKEKRQAEAAQGIPGPNKFRKALKQNKMDNSKNPVKVAIDFDYDELMMEKDIAKCAKQLLRVYTLNRKSTMPIHLHYTSLRENSKIENALKRNDGYKNWDVKLEKKSYLDLFDRDSIVYLTSDSDTVLQELDPKAVYIIGGLVDHNHHKGLSLQRAEENGLKTARLPLSEYISIKTRTVLTIVHVFEILLRVSEGRSWKDTLLEVLPQRKFKVAGSRKNSKQNQSNDTNVNNSECESESMDEDADLEQKISKDLIENGARS